MESKIHSLITDREEPAPCCPLPCSPSRRADLLCKEERLVLQALSGKDVNKALDICYEVLSLLSLSTCTWRRPWDWYSAHMSVIVDIVDKVAKELDNNFYIGHGMMLRDLEARCSFLCRSWWSTLPMQSMAMIDKEMDQEEKRLS